MKLGRSRRLGGWLRWQAGLRDAPAVGTPPARITALTASGRKVLTPSKIAARDGDTPGRPTGGEDSDERKS